MVERVMIYLDGHQGSDSHIGGTETVDLGQEFREKTDGGCFSCHFGNGKLPCSKGYEAGAYQHAGNNVSSLVSEHGGIGQTERSSRFHEFLIRHKAAV